MLLFEPPPHWKTNNNSSWSKPNPTRTTTQAAGGGESEFQNVYEYNGFAHQDIRTLAFTMVWRVPILQKLMIAIDSRINIPERLRLQCFDVCRFTKGYECNGFAHQHSQTFAFVMV